MLQILNSYKEKINHVHSEYLNTPNVNVFSLKEKAHFHDRLQYLDQGICHFNEEIFSVLLSETFLSSGQMHCLFKTVLEASQVI